MDLWHLVLHVLVDVTNITAVFHAVTAARRMGPQVRIRADPGFTKWDVEVAAPATFSRSSRLAPLFGIIFRRSSCQHPLLAGALGACQFPPWKPMSTYS